jgi:dihydroxyacetone kinase-like protein
MASREGLDKDDLVRMIERMADALEENKEYLSKLDTVIGDGDHGFGMSNGFSQVRQKLEELSRQDIGEMLKKVGFELIKSIRGSAGAIFGTFFLGQASYYECSLKGKEILTLPDVASMMEEAMAAIMKRGGASPGECTMLDALAPAVEALKKAAGDGAGFPEAFQRAAEEAHRGAESTRDMIGKRGRAKYFGERSIGHLDAGAMSTSFMFEAMAGYLAGEEDG